ncbi:1-phosphofructokinase family hexose kinase [Aliiroseovarius sp. KMU-50]|uniref:Phosphofructokinase n=1 Tax=Aliiroseovarius salicola TaxID=3009082 RepID=A0ABT4VY48_9RHOB|nr:1-phosphofructokinase family hexose kinase [Aliiroseovarius sp. KMU-50]MDA5092492.1 1-phosphofructokinase family hexose kinase [Aliiroseovarius sp. KMU-50]
MPDQLPILTVTLNPSLDMTTEADKVRPEDKIRCDAPSLDPGGGGTNVARAINILGGEATAFVALAGFRGDQIAALLAQEKVPFDRFDMPGETRLSLAVRDRAQNTQYRFVMPGPQWTPVDAHHCLKEIKARLQPEMMVVLSGSMPPGLPDDFTTSLATLVAQQKGTLLLDTSGAALVHAAQQGQADDGAHQISVLRLAQAESEMLAGTALISLRNAADFASGLIDRGAAKMVVLGRGADGSILATREGAHLASGPDVPVRSKVGAGDSFVAAFTLALANGCPPEDALVNGVAAASAAVMTDATALCTRPDFEALHPQIKRINV